MYFSFALVRCPLHFTHLHVYLQTFQNFSRVLFSDPKDGKNKAEDSVKKGHNQDADVVADRDTETKTSNIDENKKALVKKFPAFLAFLQSTPEN